MAEGKHCNMKVVVSKEDKVFEEALTTKEERFALSNFISIKL
jgi:hypothetical protein